MTLVKNWRNLGYHCKLITHGWQFLVSIHNSWSKHVARVGRWFIFLKSKPWSQLSYTNLFLLLLFFIFFDVYNAVTKNKCTLLQLSAKKDRLTWFWIWLVWKSFYAKQMFTEFWQLKFTSIVRVSISKRNHLLYILDYY